MSGGGGGRAERRARRLLAAYPWRVRAEQGDEIVGTVLDTLAPDARRMPWRDQLDLVRGGIRTRRQRRPPWPTVLAYRIGFRIHPRWIRWVFDDLERPDHVRHRRVAIAVQGAVAVAVLVALSVVWETGLDAGTPFVLVVSLVTAVVGVERERQRRRARHGLLPGGSDPSQVWVERPVGRLLPNVPVARLLVVTGVPVAAACGSALLAVLADPASEGGAVPTTADVVATVRPWAAGGVLVGVVLALVGLRRAGRAARAPAPSSPSRRVRRATTVAAGALGLVAGYLCSFFAVAVWTEPAAVSYVGLAVVFGPPALAATVVGLVLAALGRRWGAPVGLWALVPGVGPRQTVRPISRQWAAQLADAVPWRPEPERPTTGGTREGE
jgi:hypothetical protein